MSSPPRPGSADDINRMRSRLTEVEKELIRHDTRLGNGTEVFAALKDDLDQVKPKPPNVYKIVALTLSTLGLVGAAIWILAGELGNRHTKSETDTKIDSHDRHGHPDLRVDFREIQKEQARQRQMMEDGFGRLERLLSQPKRAGRRR